MDFDEAASAPLFSCGLDLASLAVSSDLLHHSWVAISDLLANPSLQTGSSPVSVEYRESQAGKFRIIAFVVKEQQKYCQGEGSGLVPSTEVPDFKFLCSKRNPEFSINKAAKALFDSVRSELDKLKDKVVKDATEKEKAKSSTEKQNANSSTEKENSEPIRYLITGNSLGGSVASLFTLWLLNAFDPTKTKRPLCITFGSPPLGDARFQQTVSDFQTWNSCFLHIVHRDDPFPGVFASEAYRPFATYLLLSESGRACFETPDTISELLKRLPRSGNQGPGNFDYHSTVEQLRKSVVYQDTTKQIQGEFDSFKAGVLLQLASIGLLPDEEDYKGTDNPVDEKIVNPEKKAITDKWEVFDPATILSEKKINLAQLEWYKKKNESNSCTYYDSYKIKRLAPDHKVTEFKLILTNYWEGVVDEVEKKPQKEEANLRKRWLYGGTNFRRLVEPLSIADFYKVRGNRNYLTHPQGRPDFYVKLERWLEQSKKPDTDPVAVLRRKKKTIKSSLTDDSCFWAHVEEAIISCEEYKKEAGDFNKLSEFPEYVFGLIKSYTVSPEIFLPNSRYMKWWEEYDGILKDRAKKGLKDDNLPRLVRFMMNKRYDEYKEGRYD